MSQKKKQNKFLLKKCTIPIYTAALQKLENNIDQKH